MSTRQIGRVLALIVMGVATVLGVSGVPANASAVTTGDVYVVHALVGTTADIYVDNSRVAAAAAAKQVVGALRLAPGNHVVTFKNAGSTIVNAQFMVKAGSSIDVVAHPAADADRKPVVTVFGNDLSPVANGQTRFVVGHVAVAPAVNVALNGTALFSNMAPGETLVSEVPSGKAALEFTATGSTSATLISNTSVALGSRTLTRAFLIGDSAAKTTDLLVQVIPLSSGGSSGSNGSGSTGAGGSSGAGGSGGSHRPNLVQTGDGGQAAGPFNGNGATLAWWSAFIGMAVAGGLFFQNRRHLARQVVGSRHSR